MLAPPFFLREICFNLRRHFNIPVLSEIVEKSNLEVHVCRKAFNFSSDLTLQLWMYARQKKQKIWSSKNPITDREFMARNNCIAGVGPASYLAFGGLTLKAE